VLIRVVKEEDTIKMLLKYGVLTQGGARCTRLPWALLFVALGDRTIAVLGLSFSRFALIGERVAPRTAAGSAALRL
jgi:hypothetical protein